jgi:SAM-dependent methyltransferase
MQNAEIIYITQHLSTIRCLAPILEIGAGWTPEFHRGPFRNAGYSEFFSHDVKNHRGRDHDFIGDICGHTAIPDELAGTVLVFNVLEHVSAPWQAVDELWRITKVGGVVMGSVPWRTPLHRWDKDYWRFCPDGVAYLFRRFRLVTLSIDGNVAMPANVMFTCIKEEVEDWEAENLETALKPEIILGNDYATPSRWKKRVVNFLRLRLGMTLEIWDGPWNSQRMREIGFTDWTVVDYEQAARSLGIELHGSGGP